MGGKGSGRPSKESSILRSLGRRPEIKTPIATDTFLPNHSGISSNSEFQNNIFWERVGTTVKTKTESDLVQVGDAGKGVQFNDSNYVGLFYDGMNIFSVLGNSAFFITDGGSSLTYNEDLTIVGKGVFGSTYKVTLNDSSNDRAFHAETGIFSVDICSNTMLIDTNGLFSVNQSAVCAASRFTASEASFNIIEDVNENKVMTLNDASTSLIVENGQTLTNIFKIKNSAGATAFTCLNGTLQSQFYPGSASAPGITLSGGTGANTGFLRGGSDAGEQGVDSIAISNNGSVSCYFEKSGNLNLLDGNLTTSGEVVIDSDSNGLDLGADQDLTLYSDGAGALKLKVATNTDITVTFEGTSNSGVLKWMEDEDYFQFNDEVKFNSGHIEKITTMNYGNDPPYQEDIDTDVGTASNFPDGYTQLVYESNLGVFFRVIQYGDEWYCSDRMDPAPLDPGNGM